MEEEFDQYSGFWWCPVVQQEEQQGAARTYRILFTVENDAAVEEYPIVQPDGTTVDLFKYPRTGTKNATVETRVLDVTLQPATGELSGRTSAALDQTLGGQFADVEYIPRAGWSADGAEVWLQLLDRRQQHLRLVLVDAAAYRAALPVRAATTLVAEEHSDCWVNVTDTCRALRSGDFLWDSEASGFRELCVLSPRTAGQRHGPWVRRALTAPAPAHPQFVIGTDTGDIAVDEAHELVFFRATLTTPLRKHVCAVSYARGADPRAVVRLTPPAYHATEFAVRAYRTADGTPCHVVAAALSNAHSPQPFVLVSTVTAGAGAAAPGAVHAAGTLAPIDLSHWAPGPDLVAPEFFSFTSARHGETLHGMVFMPPPPAQGRQDERADADEKVPVVVDVYGGPHHQSVVDAAPVRAVAKRQLLCALGYAVVCVDNVGSANRGLAFEARLRERMGTVEIADQVEALAHVAPRYGLDLRRVALTGWSYGGYAALLGLAQRPDVFRFAFAGAPVTHWEAYDTGYTERYMGLPRTEAAAYARASVVACAAQFPREPGRLLIAHGEQDENVHFEHTRALLARFDALGVPYVLRTYPGEHHGVRSPKHVLAMLTTFAKALVAAVPPNRPVV